jgi:hypothetical protein
MLNNVSPERCEHRGCQQVVTTTVVIYPGLIKHPACESHRQPARTIAEQHQAVAYRVVSAYPVLTAS